jgi:hypothetical protein
MSQSVTCLKCGASDCNEDRGKDLKLVLCSYCGHVFDMPFSEEENEVVVQTETSKQRASTKTPIKNYPIEVIVLGTVNAFCCFCDIFREIFNVTIIDPLWGYWFIALSAVGLAAWGMVVRRYVFAAVFSFTLMISFFYILLPWYHR